ncbi:MAG: endonuclease III domain-containing protein [Pirellulales bacterium]|nr:endonuclease III domain-containing protein [Pirellulales bacterium]
MSASTRNASHERSTVREVFERLLQHYGPQSWWPGETPFEVIVGALLTQNTSWKNVEQAIARLRTAEVLDPSAMYELAPEELAELIRPAGYFRLKAGRLRNFLHWLHARYEGSLEAMFAEPAAELREALLSINGIGPETADSILLYAGQIPTFVVDAYTHRVYKRHGWIEPEADYHAVQDHFHAALPLDAAMFNEYHALLVSVGKQHCGKQPRCTGCPLAEMLPPSGPCEPEW